MFCKSVCLSAPSSEWVMWRWFWFDQLWLKCFCSEWIESPLVTVKYSARGLPVIACNSEEHPQWLFSWKVAWGKEKKSRILIICRVEHERLCKVNNFVCGRRIRGYLLHKLAGYECYSLVHLHHFSFSYTKEFHPPSRLCVDWDFRGKKIYGRFVGDCSAQI